MEDTSGLLAQPSNDVSNIRMYNIRESLENEEEQQQDQQPLAFDVSHVIDHLGYGKFQRFLFVLCGIGWATDIGEVLVASFFVQSVSRQFGVTNEATKSFIASAPFVGMLCGAVVFGAMADRFGRRPAFALTCVVTGVAGLLCAASQSFEMFVFLRALVGFGLGGNLPIDFSLFLEFVPAADRRSATISLTGWSIAGTLVTAGCAWLSNVEHSESGWRVLSVLIASPSILMAFLRPWVPESPHFLHYSGRHKECMDSLDTVAKFNHVPLTWAVASVPRHAHAECENATATPSTAFHELSANEDDANDNQRYTSHLLEEALDSNIQDHPTTPLNCTAQPMFMRAGTGLNSHNDEGDDDETAKHRRGVVQDRAPLSDLFKPNMRQRSLTMILVWFAMSFGFYGFMVRVPAHLTRRQLAIDSSGLIFLASLAQIPGLLSAIALVSRVGATATISLSAALTGLSIVAFSVSETDGTVTVASYVIYNVGVSAMFAVLYLWTSVSLPTELRGTGFGACSAMNRVAGIVAPLLGGVLEEVGSERDSGLFDAVCLLVASVAALSLSPVRWCHGDRVGYTVNSGEEEVDVGVETTSPRIGTRILDTCDQRLE